MNKTLIDVIKEGGAKGYFTYDPFRDHNYKAHLHAFLFYIKHFNVPRRTQK